MSGVNSRQRRKLAVNTARAKAYGHNVSDVISGFDERQMRIYLKYLPQFESSKSHFDQIDKDMEASYGR